MTDILARWFSGGGFLPHGQSYLWTPDLLWSFVLSDATIAIAYYSILIALLYFVRRRTDIRLDWIYVLFSVFLFACGTTHLLSIWTIWQPDYWLDAAVRAIAAAISIVTALLLWPLIPRALQVPSNAQLQEAIRKLEHEVAERRQAEAALQESQARLRELAAYQEQAKEAERKRIAREIHDELGQTLLALRLDVAALHVRAGARHPRLEQRAAGALGHIDATMKSIRAIMNNLRPAVLDLGLHAAIEWQVKEFERRQGIPCELMMADDGQQVDDAQAIALFRILQESLTNVGRHAGATRVRIELRIDDSRLTLVIKDNGIGMYPKDRHKIDRFGLIGIEERVAMFGGELRIDSTPGQGTALNVSVPANLRFRYR